MNELSQTQATKEKQMVDDKQTNSLNRQPENTERSMSDADNLPTEYSDGFDDWAGNDRLIQGEHIKFDATDTGNHWKYRDGSPVAPRRWLVTGIAEVLQRWKNKKPIGLIIKQPGKSLPDIEELNAAIDRSEWETGLDGKPRPPWQHQRAVYMLDPDSAEQATFISATVGGRIGFDELKGSVLRMRQLRGQRVAPFVELKRKTFPTDFGPKPRPWLKPVDWIEIGNGAAQIAGPQQPLIEHQPTEQKLKKVDEPSIKEELADDIPF
jgi:hypothetical protein